MARWERKLHRSTQPTNAAPKGPCHRITSRTHSRTNMDGHSDLRPVHFEYRRQNAKAAEFISADLYHHPSNAIVHRECLRIYFGGLLPLP